MVTLSPDGCRAKARRGKIREGQNNERKIKIMKNRSSITIFATILSVLACFGLAFGAAGPESPDPSPFPVNSNTADGYRAIENSGNAFNSAFGWFSLFNNTD